VTGDGTTQRSDREHRQRAMLENSSDLLLFLDADGTWTANNAATRLLGYPPGYHPSHPVEFVHPDDHALAFAGLAEVLAGTRSEHEAIDVRLFAADGSQRIFQLFGKPVPDRPHGTIVITGRDVTEIRAAQLRLAVQERRVGELAAEAHAARLEARLQQAQRLESVHRLGAGIAHDFNNLLGATLNHLAVLERHSAFDDTARQALDGAREALSIAADLARRMLQAGAVDPGPTTTVHLAHVARDVVAILEPSIGEDVTVELDLDLDTPPVVAERGVLEQIVLNLVINALEAIGTEGTVRVTVRPDDDRIVVSVRDDGPGMSAAVRERAFDPFFTTKGTGTASGLGLSTVHSFVERVAGRAWIDSTPGSGTTVHIAWPTSHPNVRHEGTTIRHS
jgi:PAS domain S-box-containing protein